MNAYYSSCCVEYGILNTEFDGNCFGQLYNYLILVTILCLDTFGHCYVHYWT